jgi:CheY-like chemotaxis protein
VDVLLSGKDGREIVRHLKSQEETKHIPVIMVSAHPSAEETAREAGKVGFVLDDRETALSHNWGFWNCRAKSSQHDMASEIRTL